MNEEIDIALTAFEVRTYKNFIDSGDIAVDEEATVLVGKNEAGKSTLLDALWRLNPANEPERGFDFTLDYPRWLKKEHEGQQVAGDQPPISATFRLGAGTFERLQAEFGTGVLVAPSFTAIRKYEGELEVRVDINTEAWVRAFAASHPEIWPDPTSASTIEQLVADLETVATRLAAIDPQDEDPDEEAETDDDVERVRAAHASASAALTTATQQPLDRQIADALEELVPKFFYFDDVFLLPGSVSIDRIRTAVVTGDESGLSTDEVAAARFLRSVRLDPENLDPKNFEALRAELEAVGNLLTDRVQKFWHQNPHLEFKVEPENIEEPHPQGGAMRIADRRLHFRVNDRRHRVTTSFSTRSTGFRWFVSFLAQFSYYAEGRKDVIVLLDEPGVSLHAKAQADLLGYIDNELVPNQQVIYTTHSAWMVPVRKIHRVRTVEEDLAPEISTGAMVSGKMLAKDRDTLMPLQAALGYDVAQSLFIGPDSLVVEGISEVLYLYDMSDLLVSEGRAGLDPRWHVCPAGSVGRIPAMLGLLGNSVDTTVLIDSPANSTERGSIEDRLYDQSRLIEIGTITGSAEGDIEDLIDPNDYLTAYNACFGTKVELSDLASQAPRITKRIEHHQSAYNHGDVARSWVRERAAGRLTVSEATKQKFEALFNRVNATLTAGASVTTSPARRLLDKQLADGVISEQQYADYVAGLH